MTALPVDQAARLRQEFDRAFSAPRRAVEGRGEEFLSVRVAGVSYAVSLAEVGALVAITKIVPVLTGVKGFLGLTGFRGAVLPVYALSAFLGGSPHDAPRWLFLAGPDRVVGLVGLVGLAFDQYEGRLETSGRRPVLSLSSIVKEIRKEIIP